MTSLRTRVLIFIVAAALPAMIVADASAHTLSVARAKQAVKAVAKDLARADGLTRGLARDCERASAHKVRCKAVTKGFDSSLGATATCTRSAVATQRRASKPVRVRVGSKRTCRFDYGNGGGGEPVEPPPAPDTAIIEGPAEGSTVEAFGVGDLTPVAFKFAAIGAEDPLFECRVDAGEWEFCGGGTEWESTFLIPGLGPHTFAVRAISTRPGAKRVPDPTPATRNFTIVPFSSGP
jgi:hypothetical protein